MPTLRTTLSNRSSSRTGRRWVRSAGARRARTLSIVTVLLAFALSLSALVIPSPAVAKPGGGSPLQAVASVVGPVPVPAGSTAQARVAASGGASPYTYQWSQVSGPKVALTPKKELVSFVAPASGGDVKLAAVVADRNGQRTTAEVVVPTKSNAVAVTASGPTGSVVVGANTSLTATVTGGQAPYTYAWSQIGGDAVKLSSATSAVASFVATTPGDRRFKVVVTDARRTTGEATVVVPVSPAPPVTVTTTGPSEPVASGKRVILGAAVTGGVQPYRYAWTQTSGATVRLSSTSVADPRFDAPRGPGDLTFEVTVTDAVGGTGKASVTVLLVSDALAVTASASETKVRAYDLPELRSTVTGGRAPYAYEWKQVSGERVVLWTPWWSSTRFLVPRDAGLMTFEVTVTDRTGAKATSQVTIEGPVPACAAPFWAVWDKARAGTLFPTDLGAIGKATAGTAQAGPACDVAAGFAVRDVDVSLYNGALVGDDLAGKVTATGLCLDAGTVSLRSSWGGVAASLSATNTLCVPLGELAASPSTLTATGAPTVNGLALDGGTAAIEISPTSLRLTATGAFPVGGNHTVELAVAADGTATGTVAVTGAPVLGSTVELRGTVTGKPDVPVTGVLEAPLPAPIPVAPGVVLEGVTVKVGPGGLALAGSARIGASPEGFAAAAADAPATDGSIVVAVTGLITDGDDWVVDVTPAAGSWSVTSGLVIAGTLDGTITSAGGAVAVDVTVAAPAGGDVARWDLGGETAAVLSGARIGNGAVPAGCGAAVPSGNLWVAADGSLTLPSGSGTPFTLPMSACVDPASGSFGLRAEAAAPVALTEQVTLGDDFAFVLTGDGSGAVTGTGSGTVTITIDGKAQTVSASATRLADGTLVVGATVDLAQFGLGTGTGRLWFATGEVTSFDTGDPEVGTIDLSKGLTAALTYEIPAGAYAALTDVLGLQLPSRTVTVGTHIGGGGDTSGSLDVGVQPDRDLFANVPGGVRFEGASLDFADDHVTVDLTGPRSRAHLAVQHDGSLSGSVSVDDVPVLGAVLDAAGTITAPAGGPVTGSLTATLTGPVDLGGGVSLEDVTVTFDGSGVKLAGGATVAGSAALAVTGTYVDADDWSFSIDSANPDGWTVRSDLVLRGRLTGSIASVAGVVTFDVTAGSADQPIADWDLGSGNRLRLVSGRVTNTAAPADCTVFVPAGTVWVSAAGSLELGDATIPATACVNPSAGSWVVSADATGPIVLSDQVSLGDDLALAVRRTEDGVITGAGSGTVTFTVGGKPQTVSATISLRADGTLVVGAAVDLAQWGLGTGSAGAWFASAAAGGFDTGNPAIGTIDLPAGLTVGVSYEIPAAAFATLRDVVGLDLTSPTITVVKPVTGSGGFAGTVNVGVKPDHDLLANVPNGVRFEGATLTFADTGVTVDLTGSKGIGHLVVLNDGSLSGNVAVKGVPVFGGSLDVAGAVNAPAGGAIIGSLTATLAGPVEVGGGVSLKDLTVTLDGSGVKVAGSATVAGSASLAVTGTYVDADDWSFTIDSANPDGWAVRGDLVLRGRLTGSIASVAGVVIFDVVAGSADQPIADWDLGAGNRLRLVSGRVTNTAAPVDCAVFVPQGNVWVSAAGSLELGDATIPVNACINPSAGTWVVSAAATGPVALSYQVSLGQDLQLTVRRDENGTITGAGNGTVTFTVAGKAQTVAATITLRADGTLVVGASVDLAQWDFGTGTGQAWFSTGAVANFDTQSPLGVINLPAGFTVGITYEIPAAAYATLTDIVGLDIPDRTLEVVASAGTNGELTGTVNVGVKPDHDLLTNVPNGVRFQGATLVFTDTGVTVDLTGTKGTAHLIVLTDGSLTGNVNLADVPVFGGELDFTGAISAPAGGPITGSLTATVAGPVDLGGGASLSNLTITIDGSGVKVAGSASVAGSAALAVTGTYGDAGDWSFTINSANPDGWAVRDDLVLRGTLTGSIASLAGVVTFDVVAGSAGQPIADWDLGGGNRLRLVSGRVTNSPAPATCTTFVPAGAVWVSAAGQLELGDTVIPATACVDPAAGTWVVNAAAAGPIALSDQVSLGQDLQLTVRRDENETIAGAGNGTVTFTVAGKAQTVAATITLRADGTLVVGASVDLAQWELGTGTGSAWFSTGAVANFDTGNPAIGTINLPAGFTVGITYEIPAAAYATLTNIVGLDLQSRTLTVVASVTTGGEFTGTVNVGVRPDHDLLANVPNGVRFEGAALTFTDAGVTVDLTGPKGSGHLTVLNDGSLSGNVDVQGVPVFGGSLDFAGAVNAPAGGPVTGSLAATLAGPVEVGGGASLKDLTITLDGSGVKVAGSATVAGSAALAVTGTYVDADDWSFTIDSANPDGWAVRSDLVLRGRLTGSIASVAGVVTFDVVAGSADQPIADWDLGAGNRLRLISGRVTNTAAPADCTVFVPQGTVWVSAAGSLELGDATIPVNACVNPSAGSWVVSADATGPIVLSDQVSLGDDLALTVRRAEDGAITGSGTGTVTFTVGGKAQTVSATISLRADGALVVGATVDLAQWDLGTGSANAWFATGPVSNFDTGVPAIGTINLPAGLTVGIAYDIPAAAYSTLTNVIGLDLADPTLTVVASITSDGSFTGTVNVGVKPDHDLLANVPNGVRFQGATLVFSDTGVTVDLHGPTADATLQVATDGSLTGELHLDGVPVLGTTIDLDGTVSASAGGPITGSLSADIPGPLDLGGAVLTDVHLTLGADGFAITGDARITGPNGPLVQVEGTVADGDNWSLTVTTTTPTSWALLPSLTLTGNLNGTITSVGGAVTFDLTAGDANTALATWDLGHGNAVRLNTARVGNTALSAECAIAAVPGHVWVQATGALDLDLGSSDATIPVNACIDADTGAFAIKAAATAPIPVTDQVSIGQDLVLTVTGDGTGAVTGAGSATVTFTVAGKPQAVTATIVLRADGTLIIGASVDLARWDLGTGSAHLWYASGAVAGFDTGDPALGTVDLPGGLTVGIAYTIPESAYVALTGHLGLDIPQPTLTVLASVKADGTFSATVTVPAEADSELLPNVPGGLRLTTAKLTIDATGFQVDLDGTVGAAGTVDGHLTVGADGAVAGSLALQGVQVLGQSLDLHGTISVPVGGGLSGTLTADLPGPLTVAEGIVLSGIHVELDTGGLRITAAARIGGAEGPLVSVAGTVADDDNWSLAITSDQATGWTVRPGLTLTAAFTGTLRSVDGVVDFDLTAGSVDQALATWDLGSGNEIRLNLARVANIPAAEACASTVGAGHTWLLASGSLHLAGAGTPVDLPVNTCIDVTTGAFSINARAGAPVHLSSSVTIGEDLALALQGDAEGRIHGSGTATVTFTAAGTPQSVTATIQLRTDGTLVIGATVDLAQWDLGDGLGHVWFASKAVAGFDTGDAALGTIDLPAGLTVGVSYTIPAAAYAALTETLGLDLASPTITVVASIGASGDFTATATVRTKPGRQVVPNVPGGLQLGEVTLTLANGGVTVAAEGTAGATGDARIGFTVAADGSVSGRVELYQLPILGTAVDLVGAMSAPAGGTLTGNLRADVPGPLALGPNLSLRDVYLQLDLDGVALSGVAQIGGAGGPTVVVAGRVTDPQNWTLDVAAEATTPWTPITGLTVNANLAGTIRSVGGAVTFDLTAGTGGSALASWDLGGGNTIALTTARVANTPIAATCGTGAAAGDVWLEADGTLTVASVAGSPVAVPVHACVNATSKAFTVTAKATAPIALSTQVQLGDDLALTITGDGAGGFTAHGTATVSITVDGTPQSVTATIQLRKDGVLIVGADVDLAQWGMGGGLGHAWFATAAAKGFATGDPALGTIDLPAGLTVGISYQIPAAAYAALTETLGLDLASPTLTVVASIGDAGFSAVATVKTKPGRELVPGIPGGVRLDTANLTFTDTGVTVTFDAKVGETGTAHADLFVGSDGTVIGNLALHGVVVFGQALDLVGTLSAPAGGPLTGSATATITGPLTLTDGVVLHDITVTADNAGVKVAAAAQLGGDAGVAVRLAGSYADARNWSLRVSADAAAEYVAGPVTLNGDLTGTVESHDGAITYDVVFGREGRPVATWELSEDNAIVLTSARIANRPVAPECGLPVDPGSPWVRVEGGLAFDHAAPAGPTTLTVPISGCINLADGGFAATARTTAPIALTDQVRIDAGLALDVLHTGWYLEATGSATVSFTVDGTAQSVTAGFQLTPEGTLVISADVDLAEWGLGDGTGHVWFASTDVREFDTGDPELGYLDLPAGLTAAVAWEIPDGLYETLTEDLGLVIPDRTVKVVASITAGGRFRASVAVYADESKTVLNGIPGGVRLRGAQLTFDPDGVNVRLDASVSEDGWGHLDLRVGNDGSIAGSVELHAIRLMGSAYIDLAGTVTKPADGPLTGTITGSIEGPVFLMHDYLALDHLTVSYTDTGLDLDGTAWVGTYNGEDWGVPQTDRAVKVHVAGHLTDTDNWTVAVTTTASQPWEVTSALEVNVNVQGEISAEDGDITYDLVLGNDATPLASLAFHGHTATLQTARLSNRTAPAECGPLDLWTGQPWMTVGGSVTFAFPGGQTVTTGIEGCFDVSTAAFTVKATVADRIVLNEQVAIAPGAVLVFTGEQVWRWGDETPQQVVHGHATATVDLTVNGSTQSVEGSLRYTKDGTVLVSTAIDLAQWNLGQGAGYAWFASKAIDDVDGEALGRLSLPAGLTVGVAIPVPTKVSNALRGKLRLEVPHEKLIAIGQVGLDGSFHAEVRLRNVPFAPLGTPRQGMLEELLFTVDNGGVTLTGHGTAGDNAGNVGTFDLDIAVGADGSITGELGIDDLPVMGTPVDLRGAIAAGPNSDLTYELTADLPGPLVVGDDFTLSTIKAHLSSQRGLEISGEAKLGPPGREVTVALRGEIDGADWYISGNVTLPEWTPVEGMTFSPTFAAEASMEGGQLRWQLSAYTFNGHLFDWRPDDNLNVRVLSLGIGNEASSSCSNASPGDVSMWAAGTGGINLADGGGAQVYTYTCVNLSTGDVEVDVQEWQNQPWYLGAATVQDVGLHFERDGATGAMVFEGRAAGSINLRGRSIYLELDVDFRPEGVLIHAMADVSELTEATSIGHLFYTDIDRPGFETGDPGLGAIDLRPGFTLAGRMGVPGKIRDALKSSKLAIDLGDAEVKAIASIGLDGNFNLQVGVKLPSPGILLFSTRKSPNDPDATWMRLTEVYVGIEDSAQLEVGAQARLRFPAMQGSQESIVTVDAALHINFETGAISLGVSMQGTWHDAFGIAGLDVSQLGFEGGIDASGIPTVGLAASVVGLPDDVAQATGYQQGVPMTLAFNFSLLSPMLEIEVGAPGSTTPVMKPGSQANAANALLVYHARLYIAPKGVSIGGIRFPAGYALNFDAKLGGSPLTFAVSFDPGTKRLKGDATIPRFQIGRSITIHGLRVHLDTDPSKFVFQLNGSATFGKVNVIADISVGDGPARFDVRTVEAIPGLTAPIQVSGTMDPETGHVEGESTADVSIGDLFENAKVEMTDDGLLITFQHDGWDARATVSFSGLEAVMTKEETATIDAMPVFKAGGILRYRIHVVVNGSGFYATAGAAGVVWAEQPFDGYKHHEGTVATFTVRITDSQACTKIVGIKVCFPLSNPFAGNSVAAKAAAVPANQPAPAEAQGLAVSEAPAEAVQPLPERPATGGVVIGPEQVPAPDPAKIPAPV